MDAERHDVRACGFTLYYFRMLYALLPRYGYSPLGAIVNRESSVSRVCTAASETGTVLIKHQHSPDQSPYLTRTAPRKMPTVLKPD